MKQLISDIANEKINLEQALTRTKVIAYEIDNSILRQWVNNEINGYKTTNNTLPEYREIYSEIELLAEYPMGRRQTITVSPPEDSDDEFKKITRIHEVRESISAVNNYIDVIEENLAYLHLPIDFVNIITQIYNEKLEPYKGTIISCKRKVSKIQFQNIIDQTKHKLLDILLEINSEFPDFKTSYKNTDNDKEIVQNIVTNNIYGNNNATQMATGGNNVFGDISIKINTEVQEKLKSFGVQKQDIEELIKIDKEHPEKNENRKNRILKWVGNVTSSLAAAGIKENIPQLIEYVGNFF